MKALDAVHFARELTRRGVPAVAVFWALTDDHDLQEVARTAKPGPDGPVELVLEGADRQNRQPVGTLADSGRRARHRGRLPARREDPGGRLDPRGLRAPQRARHLLRRRVHRDAAGSGRPGSAAGPGSAGRARAASPPSRSSARPPPGAAAAPQPWRIPRRPCARRESPCRPRCPRGSPSSRSRRGGPPPHHGPRGRVGADRVREAWPSADVITRPVLKSYLFPMAVSVLGAAEIAYHAQSLPLLPALRSPAPGPDPAHARRRAGARRAPAGRAARRRRRGPSAAAGLDRAGGRAAGGRALPARPGNREGPFRHRRGPRTAGRHARRGARDRLQEDRPSVRAAGRQGAQGGGAQRRRRGKPAQAPGTRASAGRRRRSRRTLYPPLSAMLAFGRDDVLRSLRRVAGSGAEGAAVVDFGLGPEDHSGRLTFSRSPRTPTTSS